MSRSGHPAEAGSDPIREMATLCPAAAPACHPVQETEGPPCDQPVHPGSGSPDWLVSDFVLELDIFADVSSKLGKYD